MALLTALLTGYAGYGQGRQQRLQNQQEQERLASDTAYQNSEIEQEKARTAAEQKTSALNATEQGYDPNTLKPLPLTGKYEPLPKNATPEQMAEIAQRNYLSAISQNDQQGIATWGPAAKQLPGGYASIERGEYTGGPETTLTNARVGLVQAQATAMRDLPARAREIAQGHDAATLQRASMQMANSRFLAQYNYGARWNLAQLAGAYRLQGLSEQDAVRTAIADYEGAVHTNIANAQIQGREFNTEYNDYAHGGSPSYPNAPTGAPGAPPNVSVPVNITLPPISAPVTGPPPPVGAGQPGTPFASAPPRLAPLLTARASADPKVNDAIAKLSKVPKGQIQGFVFDAVMAGRYTNAEAAEILKHYGLGPR